MWLFINLFVLHRIQQKLTVIFLFSVLIALSSFTSSDCTLARCFFSFFTFKEELQDRVSGLTKSQTLIFSNNTAINLAAKLQFVLLCLLNYLCFEDRLTSYLSVTSFCFQKGLSLFIFSSQFFLTILLIDN